MDYSDGWSIVVIFILLSSFLAAAPAIQSRWLFLLLPTYLPTFGAGDHPRGGRLDCLASRAILFFSFDTGFLFFLIIITVIIIIHLPPPSF